MKNKRLWLGVLLCLVAPSALSEGLPDTGAINDLQNQFATAAALWPEIIKPYTRALFASLLTISWVWTFSMMALRKNEISEIIAELASRTVLIGFFMLLLEKSTWIASSIVKGFEFIGNKLIGSPITPSSIFDMAISLFSTIWGRLSITTPIDNWAFVLCGLGILLILSLIAMEMLVVIIQYYIFLNAGVIMMGFLGHEWSREYSINYFRLMIGIGLKMFVMQLIVALTITILDSWIKNSNLTMSQIIIMLPMCLILWGLIREIPKMAQSLASGHDTTSNNAMASTLKSVLTVAAVVAAAQPRLPNFSPNNENQASTNSNGQSGLADPATAPINTMQVNAASASAYNPTSALNSALNGGAETTESTDNAFQASRSSATSEPSLPPAKSAIKHAVLAAKFAAKAFNTK